MHSVTIDGTNYQFIEVEGSFDGTFRIIQIGPTRDIVLGYISFRDMSICLPFMPDESKRKTVEGYVHLWMQRWVAWR
jgi:hypothetical protein